MVPENKSTADVKGAWWLGLNGDGLGAMAIGAVRETAEVDMAD